MTELPPLPEPDTHCWDEDAGKDCWSHSKEQVRAYAALVRAQALEDAARVCDGLHKTRFEDPRETTAELCAVVIRALGDTK